MNKNENRIKEIPANHLAATDGSFIISCIFLSKKPAHIIRDMMKPNLIEITFDFT